MDWILPEMFSPFDRSLPALEDEVALIHIAEIFY